MERFIITKNNCLKTDTVGYYSLDYVGGYPPDPNTQFIRDLKNTFNKEKINVLNEAREKAVGILKEALKYIIRDENLQDCIIVAVPRSKAFDTYFDTQLFLIDSMQIAAEETIGAIDGTGVIRRHTNTRTTHLRTDIGRRTPQENIDNVEGANDGELPYPGITKDTCYINADAIKDRQIILVDDIYTKTTNVDEDCIQALYDCGAQKVIFYSFAKTVNRYELF